MNFKRITLTFLLLWAERQTLSTTGLFTCTHTYTHIHKNGNFALSQTYAGTHASFQVVITESHISHLLLFPFLPLHFSPLTLIIFSPVFTPLPASSSPLSPTVLTCTYWHLDFHLSSLLVIDFRLYYSVSVLPPVDKDTCRETDK